MVIAQTMHYMYTWLRLNVESAAQPEALALNKWAKKSLRQSECLILRFYSKLVIQFSTTAPVRVDWPASTVGYLADLAVLIIGLANAP